MPAWLSYAPADLVPYSLDTYLRLLERYDAVHAPVVLAGLLLGFTAVVLLRRPGPRILAALTLAFGCCWLWIAWAFLARFYATLNWVGPWLAWGFAVQGLMLLVAALALGLRGDAAPVHDRWGWVGYGLIGFGVTGLPLLALTVGGREWSALGLFGTAPDATAVATLGLAALLRLPFAWLLGLLPALWCCYAAMRSAVLADPLWWILSAAALVGLADLIAAAVRRAGLAH